MALRLFAARPEHPLADPGEAARVIEALPRDRPEDAVQELQHWLGSLRDFDGFACDERLALVKRLDEVARPLAAELFAGFLAKARLRGRNERKREELLQAFGDNLCGAYARCVSDNEKGEARAREIREELPLALGRAYRAAYFAAKVRAMLYLPALRAQWPALYQPLAFAEVAHFDAVPVRLYEREVVSSPRAELLKLLAFELIAARELPPEQVELASRVLDRVARSFVWGLQPSAACTALVDLASAAPPRFVAGDAAAAGRRFFGAGPALARLAEWETLSARDVLSDEVRFGPEFGATQIVSVIRHLLRYLWAKPPRRQGSREASVGRIQVLHGFDAICQSVPAIDIGKAALREDLEVAARKQQGSLQVEAEVADARPEAWIAVDRSAWGIGASAQGGLAAWAQPGSLCAVRDSPAAPWAVAIVRRMEAGAAAVRCGLQILSKKPVSVWLRVLGRQGQEVSNWESSTGSFAYDYSRAIVLPDAPKAGELPVLLLAAGKFVPEQICEIVMGEHSPHIRLAQFIEEGADYARAAFAWVPRAKS